MVSREFLCSRRGWEAFQGREIHHSLSLAIKKHHDQGTYKRQHLLDLMVSEGWSP